MHINFHYLLLPCEVDGGNIWHRALAGKIVFIHPSVWILQTPCWIDGQSLPVLSPKLLPSSSFRSVLLVIALVEDLIICCLGNLDNFLPGLLQTMLHDITREMVLQYRSGLVTLGIATYALMPYMDYATLQSYLLFWCPVTKPEVPVKSNPLLYFYALHSLIHLPLTPCLFVLFFKDCSALLRCEDFLSFFNILSHHPEGRCINTLHRPIGLHDNVHSNDPLTCVSPK